MKTKQIMLLGIEAGRGAGTAGAQHGPVALRQRGLIARLESFGHTIEDLGDIPGVYETRFGAGSRRFVKNLPNVLQVNRHSHAAVLGSRRRDPDAFLLIVGGDHSIAIGTLAGLADSCNRLGLLWIDAHADYNTPDTSTSGNIHGMSLAVACGHGVNDLRTIAGKLPMIRESDVHLCGIRDVDSGERTKLAASNVHCLSADEFRSAGIAEAATAAIDQLAADCDHVHMSFDIDVLDASEVPGTGTPVPGGLSAEEAVELLTALSQRDVLQSAEFVEYNPALDRDDRTAEVTLRLIETLFQTAPLA
jgi:arginase